LKLMPLPRLLPALGGAWSETWLSRLCPRIEVAWTGLSSLGAAPDCCGATKIDDTVMLASSIVLPMVFKLNPPALGFDDCATVRPLTASANGFLDENMILRASRVLAPSPEPKAVRSGVEPNSAALGVWGPVAGRPGTNALDGLQR